MLRNVVRTFFILCLLSTHTYADYDSATIAFEAGDYEAAVKQLLPLAKAGEANSQAKLGLMYAEELGVQQDYAEAVKWFRMAADQGNAVGQSNLGFMYQGGLGVQQDYAEAVKWLRRAAEQRYVVGQFNLGLMYYHGYGVPQDNTQAYAWIGIAATSGFKSAQDYRDPLEAKMSPGQLEEAKKLASELWEEYGNKDNRYMVH